MSKINEEAFNEINTLEIHYWFRDGSHTMDAFIENKCEHELLGLIREIANYYSFEIDVETEPLGEGGLRRWLRIISKGENKDASISKGILIGILTAILITPISKISDKLIDKVFEDAELNELQKEKLRLEIEKLKQETNKTYFLEDSSVIKKKRSNFYEALDSYSKIEKVSYLPTNDRHEKVLKEKVVEKADFKKFVLVTDDLEPITIEEAVIEIVSPVLKKGKYKWIGIYQNETVAFSMKSNEFKTLVQNGEIEFKNGSSINCLLEIRRKIDNEGKEIIVGYDVLRINHYFQNDQPIETKEGRKHRYRKEANESQTNIFDYLREEYDDE